MEFMQEMPVNVIDKNRDQTLKMQASAALSDVRACLVLSIVEAVEPVWEGGYMLTSLVICTNLTPREAEKQEARAGYLW